MNQNGSDAGRSILAADAICHPVNYKQDAMHNGIHILGRTDGFKKKSTGNHQNHKQDIQQVFHALLTAVMQGCLSHAIANQCSQSTWQKREADGT